MSAIKRFGALAVVLLVIALTSGFGTGAHAQDDGEDDTVTIETTRTARVQDEPTPTEEPVDESEDVAIADPPTDEDTSRAASPNTADIQVDDLYQTIAQGLAAFDEFSNGMWRITELNPKSVDEAPSVIAPYYGFLYQMNGTTIIRNDTTGKRARLEPGEAYYFSANDTYTRYREDETSRAWLIEVVPSDADPADSAGTVIFFTDEIGSFPDDTRDLELISGNLQEGESSSIPDYEADCLIIVTVGTLEVTGDSGTKVLLAPAAFMMTSEFEIENNSSDPAVYAIAKIGPSVGNAAPAAPTSSDDDEVAADDGSSDETDTTEDEVVDPWLDTDADTLIDSDELVYGTDPEIADTDYDGYSDGDEVWIYETDPLDGNSYP